MSSLVSPRSNRNSNTNSKPESSDGRLSPTLKRWKFTSPTAEFDVALHANDELVTLTIPLGGKAKALTTFSFSSLTTLAQFALCTEAAGTAINTTIDALTNRDDDDDGDDPWPLLSRGHVSTGDEVVPIPTVWSSATSESAFELTGGFGEDMNLRQILALRSGVFGKEELRSCFASFGLRFGPPDIDSKTALVPTSFPTREVIGTSAPIHTFSWMPVMDMTMHEEFVDAGNAFPFMLPASLPRTLSLPSMNRFGPSTISAAAKTDPSISTSAGLPATFSAPPPLRMLSGTISKSEDDTPVSRSPDIEFQSVLLRAIPHGADDEARRCVRVLETIDALVQLIVSRWATGHCCEREFGSSGAPNAAAYGGTDNSCWALPVALAPNHNDPVLLAALQTYRTPLSLLATLPLSRAVHDSRRPLMRQIAMYLLATGAARTWNELDAYGFTPLMRSALQPHSVVAECIVAHAEVTGAMPLPYWMSSLKLPLLEIEWPYGPLPSAPLECGLEVCHGDRVLMVDDVLSLALRNRWTWNNIALTLVHHLPADVLRRPRHGVSLLAFALRERNASLALALLTRASEIGALNADVKRVVEFLCGSSNDGGSSPEVQSLAITSEAMDAVSYHHRTKKYVAVPQLLRECTELPVTLIELLTTFLEPEPTWEWLIAAQPASACDSSFASVSTVTTELLHVPYLVASFTSR